jgi:hypothetical protein
MKTSTILILLGVGAVALYLYAQKTGLNPVATTTAPPAPAGTPVDIGSTIQTGLNDLSTWAQGYLGNTGFSSQNG